MSWPSMNVGGEPCSMSVQREVDERHHRDRERRSSGGGGPMRSDSQPPNSFANSTTNRLSVFTSWNVG